MRTVLSTKYGWPVAHAERLPRGHSNESFLCRGTDGTLRVVRRSWSAKSGDQTASEESILRGLPSTLRVPRLIPTLSGARHVLDAEGRTVQVFQHLAGVHGAPWLAASETKRAFAIGQQLARLHAAMPVAAGRNSVEWLRARLERVRSSPLPANGDAVLERIESLLNRVEPGPVQWLHGDFHLGNLLFDDAGEIAVVDFDQVGCGSPRFELAFALFAISRTASDDPFRFHRALWDAGLAGYGGVSIDPFDFLDLFCADQVLIHLNAMQSGFWAPTPGIGFHACWAQLCSREVIASGIHVARTSR